uniref:N-alpha-acetyltransferase 40 n=1 Tax=Trichuris muris TaxID=70415 RepID=A0A5S6R2D2_TRIMR
MPSFHGIDLRIAAADCLDEQEFEVLISLLQDNMRQYYELSTWGWNEKAKRKEMRSPSARHLLARCEETHGFAGFCHFRFVMDCGYPVLYCYEIQVASAWRRSGLGTAMLEVLHQLACRCRMKKIVATVFRHNEPSLSFFKKHSFLVDSSSPPGLTFLLDVHFGPTSSVCRSVLVIPLESFETRAVLYRPVEPRV